MILRLLIVLLFFAILFFIMRNNIEWSLLNYFSIFSAVIAVISCYFIENELYIIELAKYSFSTNGIYRLILYLLLFFLSFNLFCGFFNKNISIKKPKGILNNVIYKYIILISIVFLIYLFSDLVISGIPLLNSSLSNKYNYFVNVSKLPFTKTLYVISSLYIPIILSLLYDTDDISKNKKKCIILIIISICIYLFLLGFKVSGIRQVIIEFILILAYRKYISKRLSFNFKTLKKIFIILVILLCGVAFNYSVFSNGQTIKEKFESRTLALTSHFWWITDNYRINNEIELNTISDNFDKNIVSIFNNDYYPSTGVVKLMYKFAPSNIVSNYLSNNILMGANFITVSIYDYGYILTIIVVILIAYIYSLILNYLRRGFISGNVLEIVLTYRLLTYLDVFAWKTGSISDFLNFKNIIIILIVIIYELLITKKEKTL